MNNIFVQKPEEHLCKFAGLKVTDLVIAKSNHPIYDGMNHIKKDEVGLITRVWHGNTDSIVNILWSSGVNEVEIPIDDIERRYEQGNLANAPKGTRFLVVQSE